MAARIAALQASAGSALVAEVLARTGAGDPSLLPAASVEELRNRFGLSSARELALLVLPAAAAHARPPISGYRVGAIGVARSGELILGGNLEFPGASIHHTVHAEGFVTLRSRALGLPLDALAIGEARPCAHCRQVLAEMAWADELRLIDPFGAEVGLWDVYPAAFVPGDLGMAAAGSPQAAVIRTVSSDLAADVRLALRDAATRAHAPYSGEPAAIVLRTMDGRLFGGAVLESVAFNPTIGPLQDALVELAAAGVPFGDVWEAWLGTVREARVAHEAPTRDLLSAVAPEASLQVTYWA